MMIHQFKSTAAASVAVVFLLFIAGGCAFSETSASAAPADAAVRETSGNAENGNAEKRRRKRRRASDYSRIPVNAPAEWQIQSVGN